MSEKIILAMISGNEADVLPRCIESWRPAIDGLVVVFARGAAQPDDTEERVREVCARLNLPFVLSTYENAPEHADWPHTDDFAAARCQAYRAAQAFGTMSGGLVEPGWVVWSDADDVLAQSSVEVIRQTVKNPPAPVLFAPYVLDASGGYTKRERLARIEAYNHWRGRVHERIVWNPDATPCLVPEIQIFHMPKTGKRGSPDRNLRILESIPEAEREGRDWFYLFSEYLRRYNIPQAIAAGIRATEAHDLTDEERYQVFLNMGRWIKELSAAERPVLEAMRMIPGRREAFAEMAWIHLHRDDGSPEKALAWLRAMRGIELPEDPGIWHNPTLYDWQADDLEDLARWKCGQRDRAAQSRETRFAQAGRRISVLHATQNPAQALHLRREWLERAALAEAIEWIYCVGDDETFAKLEGYAPARGLENTREAARAAGAAVARGRVVIHVDDDMHAPQAWDLQVWQSIKTRVKQPVRLVTNDPTITIATPRGLAQEAEVIAAPIDFSRTEPPIWRGTVDAARVRISVAHPTCRPEKARAIKRQWLDMAAHPERIEYIFGTEAELAGRMEGEAVRISQPVPVGHSTAVVNYNAAAMACTGEIIIAAQDDIEPPQGWDDAIAAALGPYIGEAKVLHVHDGFRADQLMVIMCVTADYLRAQGYLLCPEYDGYWSDTEFSWRAYQSGQVIDGRHIRFFHNHPCFTGAASDVEYMRQSNPEACARGEAIFRRRNPECGW